MLYCGDMNGTERMALATCVALRPHYADVVLLAPRGRSDWTLERAAQTMPGLRVATFDGRADLLHRLLRLCSGVARVDFISASVGHALAGVLLAKALSRAGTHLHVVHGGSLHLSTDLRHKRLLNWWPVRLVAVSPFIARLLAASGVHRCKIVVIENFLLEAGAMSAPSQEQSPDRAPRGFRYRIAVVARVVPMKRLDLIVTAARLGLLDDVLIEIFGAGYGLEQHRAQAAGLPNVVFHGYVRDVAPRIAGANAVLHTNANEPFGLVILEAFRARVPVVAPDAGGAADIVQDRLNGLLYRADDVRSMCAALRSVFDMPPAERRAMVDRGYADVLLRYSVERGAKQYAQALGLPAAQAPERRS